MEALAERMQSSKQTVHRHETTTDVSLSTMIRYAEILDIRVEELLSESLRVPQTIAQLVRTAERLAPEQQALLTRLGDTLAQSTQTVETAEKPLSRTN